MLGHVHFKSIWYPPGSRLFDILAGLLRLFRPWSSSFFPASEVRKACCSSSWIVASYRVGQKDRAVSHRRVLGG